MTQNKLIGIVGNGNLGSRTFVTNALKNAKIVICTDGGADKLTLMKIIPDFIIGDMDSVSKTILQGLKKNSKTQVLFDPDQNATDMELAIRLANSMNPSEIIIIGAIGSRMDHTIANLYSLTQLRRGIKAKIIDEHNEIELVRKKVSLQGKKGDIISVIPLGPIRGLTYTGLKWNVKNWNKQSTWFGICNVMTGSRATISLTKGKVLVMRTRD